MSEFQEETQKIIEKIKTKSLVINRVPKNIKDEFINFADEEFESDYGMCLKSVWDNFKLWKMFFENIDMKLDKIIELIGNESQEEEIKLLSGKSINKREVKIG